MLALNVTHVLDPMTPYIVVPGHTVVCVCVCVCVCYSTKLVRVYAKYIHSTVSIDIYSIYSIIMETM